MKETDRQLPLLVVGAGPAGMTAALEAAETGAEVVLMEREAYVGGRVAALYQYFPKMCPPSCGVEINVQRLERNPRVRVMTQTTLERAERVDGHWRVTCRHEPAYVNDRCTACGECTKACPATVADPFNLGLGEAPAIRLAHPQAWPQRFVLDREACPDGCAKCAEACEYDAVKLDAEVVSEDLEVAAVVVATGWRPYPLEKLGELGGDLPDVISNVQMERLASPSGPTGGAIRRPSDGEAPRRVAFVQCAGSRDVNHLPYCSGVCCLATLKQVQYVKAQDPDAEITVFYIDRRTPGRNEDVLVKVAALDGIRMVKGKVGSVVAEGRELVLAAEDVEAGVKLHERADLVVLATGMVPNQVAAGDPLPVELDDDGFVVERANDGLVVAGVARRPEDVAATVRDATGAAGRAMAVARTSHRLVKRSAGGAGDGGVFDPTGAESGSAALRAPGGEKTSPAPEHRALQPRGGEMCGRGRGA